MKYFKELYTKPVNNLICVLDETRRAAKIDNISERTLFCYKMPNLRLC